MYCGSCPKLYVITALAGFAGFVPMSVFTCGERTPASARNRPAGAVAVTAACRFPAPPQPAASIATTRSPRTEARTFLNLPATALPWPRRRGSAGGSNLESRRRQMKRLIAAGAAAATAAMLTAGGASAATPSVASLAAQVKALNAQVKVMKAQVKTLQTRERFDRAELQANYAGDACLAAGIADLFQSTWAAIDNGSSAPKFVGAGPIDDKQACTVIDVKRPGVTTSPTTSFLAGIVGWLFG